MARLVGGARSLIVFPEGTRSVDGTVGAVQGRHRSCVAIDAGLPVVPVSIAGSRHVMLKGRLMTCRATSRSPSIEPIPTAGVGRERCARARRAGARRSCCQRRRRAGDRPADIMSRLTTPGNRFACARDCHHCGRRKRTAAGRAGAEAVAGRRRPDDPAAQRRRVSGDTPRSSDVIVAVPAELLAAPPTWLDGVANVRLVAGGARRQDSVANAFDAGRG